MSVSLSAHLFLGHVASLFFCFKKVTYFIIPTALVRDMQAYMQLVMSLSVAFQVQDSLLFCQGLFRRIFGESPPRLKRPAIHMIVYHTTLDCKGLILLSPETEEQKIHLKVLPQKEGRGLAFDLVVVDYSFNNGLYTKDKVKPNHTLVYPTVNEKCVVFHTFKSFWGHKIPTGILWWFTGVNQTCSICVGGFVFRADVLSIWLYVVSATVA